MKLAKGLLTVPIAYSEPIEGDQYDLRGRLSLALFQGLVPQLKEADIYVWFRRFCSRHGGRFAKKATDSLQSDPL